MRANDTDTGFDPVEERLPAPRLFTLGLQHVLVMYAGAVAVPLIIGRALQLEAHDVAFLISADLFVCGVVTIIQSFGATRWLGIRLPVMMGVTFAAVGPMVAIANSNPGIEGARMLFGSIIAAGIISTLLAPVIAKLIRFFPTVVTGTVILATGVALLPVGIHWLFGMPVGPTAPKLVDPEHAAWLEALKAAGGVPESLRLAPTVANPEYASHPRLLIGVTVLGAILLIAKFGRGFFSNISVLMGILVGGIAAAAMGMMHFDNIAKADWFAIVAPLHFGMPIFDPIMILTMTVVMCVVMIESTGMFLALGELCGRKIDRENLSAGLRVDGVGTLIGGLFNTFPYTSFSQNVGLVGVTGVRSRFVCVAGGVIMVVLGLIPKMAAIVEALPTTVLGGAGLVMFGMVAATGIRILSNADFKTNKHNMFIVAISLGVSMIPMIAPEFDQWLPHSLHVLMHSGILLAAISALLLNWFFNGVADDGETDSRNAALAADAH